MVIVPATKYIDHHKNITFFITSFLKKFCDLILDNITSTVRLKETPSKSNHWF